MSETTDKGVNAYTAYIAVALVAAAACCAIPLIAHQMNHLMNLHTVDE